MLFPLLSSSSTGHARYQPPSAGMGHRLPWSKNWPGARYGAGQEKRKTDPRFSTLTRQQRRRQAMARGIAEISSSFGGETRRRRRAMGIALGQRRLRQAAAVAGGAA
jgi:hypothetical protein